MAYVPPHMRQAKGAAASSPPAPAPPPESVIPRFQRNLNLMSKNYHKKALYAENAISKWFIVGLADEARVPDLARLEPVAVRSLERNPGEKPLSLVLKEIGEDASEILSKSPWDFVAEIVKHDFVSSFQRVKDAMRDCKFGEIKPTLLLRFGQIHFHGSRSFTAESMIGSSPSAGTLKQIRKSFYSNIPSPYVAYIRNDVLPQFDFEFEEKEIYQVKLSDNTQPDSTVSCKCTVAKDANQLEIFKIELNPLRNLVADMSCLDKSLDLRLMLCTKSILVPLMDEELENIKSLIASARLDSEVKGGVRWPLGKQSSGNRYTVVKVWHTISETFTNSSVRFKIRRADRFDFLCSSGEAAKEVSLTMPGIVPLLREQTVNTELAFEMLKENLKLIWKHFLLPCSFTRK